MLPSNIAALLVVIVAVLPGATFTWGFERQAGQFGVGLADRTLRFVAVSVLWHLILGWPEYLLYRVAFNGRNFSTAQFAAAWGAVLLLTAVPAATGSFLGSLYAKRNTGEQPKAIHRAFGGPKRKRVFEYIVGHERAPRAWDDLFSEHPTIYIRVRTTDGAWLAGLFAKQSYAAGYPNDTDLYLEQAWGLKDGGTVLAEPLGYSLYIPAARISWLEIINPYGN
jgi:hypothetical protein